MFQLSLFFFVFCLDRFFCSGLFLGKAVRTRAITSQCYFYSCWDWRFFFIFAGSLYFWLLAASGEKSQDRTE
jgi:hypothetical protein